MPRPYRPNTSGASRGTKALISAHMRQETAHERRARKREEAEIRNEMTDPMNTKKARLAKILEKEALAVAAADETSFVIVTRRHGQTGEALRSIRVYPDGTVHVI